MNLIHTSPKDLPGMLCVLDDLGLRFNKDVMDEFEKDCASLWAPKRHRIKRNSSTTINFFITVYRPVGLMITNVN
uniref:Uncharacterized protein n=1 Tax=Panagrolaimus davidi TaxID=227884 RepID=A0A914PVL0_9BILA